MIQVKGVHKSYSKIGGGFFKKDKLHVLKGIDLSLIHISEPTRH